MNRHLHLQEFHSKSKVELEKGVVAVGDGREVTEWLYPVGQSGSKEPTDEHKAEHEDNAKHQSLVSSHEHCPKQVPHRLEGWKEGVKIRRRKEMKLEKEVIKMERGYGALGRSLKHLMRTLL